MALALGQVADLEAAERWPSATPRWRWRRGACRDQALSGPTRWANCAFETNQPAFDRLVNDWLPYQLLTARLWGRCGPSQRGGAFGFRDQLQDVLPLFAIRPDLARRQILLHARPAVPGGRCAAMVAPGRDRRHRPRRPQQRVGPASLAALSSRRAMWRRRVTIRSSTSGLPFLEGPSIPPEPRASTSCRGPRARRPRYTSIAVGRSTSR